MLHMEQHGKRNRQSFDNRCLVCGRKFTAKRMARFCGGACRVFAFRYGIPFGTRDRLPRCPWALFIRLGSFYRPKFRAEFDAWCKKNIDEKS